MSTPGRPIDAWAILIGINEYADPHTHPPLRCCVRDAIGLYLLLTHPGYGNFDPQRVVLLIDGSPAEVQTAVDSVAARFLQIHGITFRPGIASEILNKRQDPRHENILAQIHRTAHGASPDDLLLVHCSGHGYVFDGSIYLVPPGAQPPLYAETAISLDGVKKRLSQAPARHKVLILDACYSGSAATTPAVPANDKVRQALLADTETIQVLASCLPWEQCYEHADDHGIFTWFLLEGLTGKADVAGRGHVTLEDLYRHIDSGVRKWVGENVAVGPLQTPTLAAGSARSAILSRYRTSKPDLTGANPFVWRNGITDASAFFNRDEEQNLVRLFVQKRQNVQVVGNRRIGKTSLLRHIERGMVFQDQKTVAAYLDLQSPQCFTLSGWLRQAGRRLGWPTPPADLADFAESVEDQVTRGGHLVLCLDEFEELTQRREQFTRDFFLMLRSCGQMGLSIVTASQHPLSELTDASDPVSPFYNTFPLVRLGPFSEVDSGDFVAWQRPETPGFTPEERAAILGFARGQPLALEVACFHVLGVKRRGGGTAGALRQAVEEMNALIPGCSGGPL